MGIEDKETAAKMQIHAIRSMLESDRPQVLAEGALRRYGFLRETNQGGIILEIRKYIVSVWARHSLGWTSSDIDDSIEAGRFTGRLLMESLVHHD